MNSIEMPRRRALKITCGLALCAQRTLHATDDTRGGIVMGEPKAAEVGNRVLQEGGNAIDAIVAGALAGALHAPNQYGIGGYGGHMIVRSANGSIKCIDFNTTAPGGAKVANYGWRAAGV